MKLFPKLIAVGILPVLLLLLTAATPRISAENAGSGNGIARDNTLTKTASAKRFHLKPGTNAGKVSGNNPFAGFSAAPFIVPNISYPAGAKVYNTGTAITPLTITNTGGAVPASTPGAVTTIAGTGTSGSADNATATLASFNQPFGMAFDGSGNLFIADNANNKIRKMTPAGVVTTFAGTGASGSADNATGTLATFNQPVGIAIDASGNLFVAETGNNKIRKITSAGAVTTFAGTGASGSADNATGTLATFFLPVAIAIDASANLYISDFANNKIRKITSAGAVTTLAGSGASGSADNAIGTLATFNTIFGINVDASGNVYVADRGNFKIRKITSTGAVSTFAGSGSNGSTDNISGTSATFTNPYAIGIDGVGNLYVVDRLGSKIRKITPAGAVTTLAGNGTFSSVDGIGTSASFNAPAGVVVDASYNVYISEGGNLIRKIAQFGYSISPALPAGLSFNATTGTISGTPTAVTAATNYTVTAINTDGIATTTVNIAIITPSPAIIVTGTLSSFSSCVGTASAVTQSFTVSGNTLTADINITAPTGFEVATVTGGVYSSSLTLTQSSGVVNATTIFARLMATATGSPSGAITCTSAGATAQSITLSGTVNALPAVTLGTVNGILTSGTSFSLPYSGATGSPNQYSITTGTTAMSGFTTVNNATLSASPISVPIPASAANTYNFNLTLKNSTTGCVSASNPFTLLVSAPLASPVISYATSTQVYGINTAITPLTLTNTGGAVPGVALGVTTFAGTGTAGSLDSSIGVSAQFSDPIGITYDPLSGNVYVSDRNTNKIRKISSTGVTTTLAGSGTGALTDGTGVAASFFRPLGLTVDGSGNIYVADLSNNAIRKITPAGVVSTFAGSSGRGSQDGTGTAAGFFSPSAVAIDGSGNLYVTDNSNYKIRKITPAGVVTTLAGSGTLGSTDATGALASFNNIYGIAVDGSGNVYVADLGIHKIRKITPGGVVTTFAGSGTSGSADGTGALASFNSPSGLVIDANGNLYVSENSGNKIRKITPAGVVTTIAGSAASGSINNANPLSASFSSPFSITIDGAGNLYVADENNNKVRKISLVGYGISPTLPAGLSFDATTGIISGTPTVTSAATNYTITATNATGTSATTVNITTVRPTISLTGSLSALASCTGTASVAAQSFSVSGIYLTGDISVTAPTNFELATSSGGAYSSSLTLTQSGGTFSSTLVFVRLTATAAAGSLSGIIKVTSVGATVQNMTATGSVHALPAITLGAVAGVLTNITSFSLPYSGATGSPNQYSITTGSPTAMGSFAAVSNAALGASPISVTIPASAANTYNFNLTVKNSTTGCVSAANAFTLVVSAPIPLPNISYAGSTQIYRMGTAITPLTMTNTGGAIPVTSGGVTTVAGSGTKGSAEGTGAAASFSYPRGVAVDASGNVYVADNDNYKILKITSAGVVTTLAGSGTQGSADGTGVSASFYPSGGHIAVDASGNIYVADQGNSRIRKITPAGVVTTLAGGVVGSADGTGVLAKFFSPRGIAVDVSGNVYVSDALGNKIRKITPAGVVTTLAGSGTSGSADGTGTSARFYQPYGIAVDASGNVYVAETGNNIIRKISSAGVVTKLAGSATRGAANGIGAAASFRDPAGIAVDASGNLYVTDASNNSIRKISSAGVVTTLSGGGSGSTDGSIASAKFFYPFSLALDASDNIYIADTYNHKIRKIAPELGYSISPALPAGLSLDGTTGAISGTPTVTSVATNYTITATNATGSSSAKINLTVIAATISVTGTLSSFKTCSGTASTPQAVTVSGSNLIGNINVVAPSGFEVATTSAGTYSNSISLTQTGGIVSGTPVYIRLSSSATAATAFGVISCTSVSAVGQSLPISTTLVTINPLPTAPSVTAGSAVTFCSGGSVVLSSNATTGNQWYKDATLISNATGVSYTATSNGSYTAIVTNTNGCVSAASTASVVTVNTNPAATIAEGSQLAFANCATTSINLNANAGLGFSYQWSNASGIISNATSQQYSVTASGDYTVKVTDANNCFAVSAVTKILSVPTATAGGNTSVCAGTTVSLSAGGSFTSPTYQWLKDGAAINGATAATYAAIATGSYHVSITSAGVTTGSCPVIVSINPLPTITTAANPGNTVCSGTPLAINATVAGTNTYQWLNNGHTISNARSSSLNIIASGLYSVRVTDANGCINTSNSTALVINPLPILTPVTGTTVVNVNSTTNLLSTPGGGAWSSSNTSVATVNATGLVTGVSAGTATISYTLVNTNNCSATVNTLVTVNGLAPKPIISAGSAISFCAGGSVVLTSNELTGNQWYKNNVVIGGATGSTYKANASGSYTVFAAGTASDPVEVAVTAIPDATIQQGAQLAFTNCANTSINLTAANNILGLTYQWRNANGDIANATEPLYIVTSADNYSLRVTDGICSATSGITKITALPTASVTGNTVVCASTIVNLSVDPGAVTSPTFQWQNGAIPVSGATSASFNPTTTGNYTAVVTASGISSTSCAIAITVNALPVVTITPNTTVCAGNSVTLTATTSAATYQWLGSGNAIGSATTNSYITSISDQYSVQVTDNNGCINTSMASTVTVNPLPVLSAIAGSGSVCVNSTVNLSNTASGGVWSSTNTTVALVDATGVVTGVAAGTATISYTVTTNDCSTTVTKSITVNPLAAIVTQPVVSITQCAGTNASISITATGTGLGYQWYLNGTAVSGAISNTYSKNGLAVADAGNYTVVVTGGCSNITSDASVWTINALPVIAAITGTTTVCVGSTTQLANTAVGGVWSSTASTVATVNSAGLVTGVSAGTTIITYTVTNASGCVSSISTTVTVNALPVVTATSSFASISKGLTTQLQAVVSAGNIQSYIWTPGTHLNNSVIANPLARVVASTTYVVLVTTTQGCTASASINVVALEDINVALTNVFTPNGDGINDRFVIKNLDQYPDNRLQVFDRTGKILYEKNNYANQWDGSVGGIILTKDTYFYVLTVKGQIVKKGTITLVR